MERGKERKIDHYCHQLFQVHETRRSKTKISCFLWFSSKYIHSILLLFYIFFLSAFRFEILLVKVRVGLPIC
ncbi:hypothetical protein J0J28_24050, partial [Vibrio vulnificus]|nr:hypothetical protein [Vibrio vulnificus]